MRIAFFIKRTTFHEGYGGMETQNKLLCEGLVSRGLDITVFSPKRELVEDSIEENGVKYIFVSSVFKTIRSKKDQKSWYNRSYESFASEHKKSPYDLVVSQSSAGVGVLKHREQLGLRGVSIAHGSIISELQTRQKNATSVMEKLRLVKDTLFSIHVFFTRQREFVHSSDHIIAVSKYVQSALISETYASEDKFTVIYNGVDIDKMRAVSAAPEVTALGLLFVGRLEKEKGCDVLIKMSRDPDFTNVTLDVYGSGSMQSNLEAAQATQGDGCTLIVHGSVPHVEVLSAYNPNKIFLFPTNRIEGFPMVLVEAMLGGCSIVANDLGGVADAVLPDKTGFLVTPESYDTFKSRVIDLINSPNLARELGENARIVAQREFSLEKMLSRYINIFNKVVSK